MNWRKVNSLVFGSAALFLLMIFLVTDLQDGGTPFPAAFACHNKAVLTLVDELNDSDQWDGDKYILTNKKTNTSLSYTTNMFSYGVGVNQSTSHSYIITYAPTYGCQKILNKAFINLQTHRNALEQSHAKIIPEGQL